ncbi:tetratricopeptide repeat-containing sensor histidine kinase [Spirosoma arcticum]
MRSFQKVGLLLGWLGLPVSLQAQHYDTPPFNFDRSTDQVYVDSLLRATRTRLLGLDQLRPTPTVDTARMEYLHFMAYVHYSGMAHRDSALLVANHLIRMAERKKNVKYQIKGLLLTERYYRSLRTNYPQAINLNYRLLSLIETSPQVYAMYYWRIYRNLGNVSMSIGEYGDAVAYLQQSIAWFDKDKKIDPVHLASLHQYLATAYKQQPQLDKAETHFLLAWKLLNQSKASISNKAYLTNDIGRLYNRQQKPAQAVPYLSQSVAYWAQLNAPMPQAVALADLAESYLGLGRYAEAINTATQALGQNQQLPTPMLTAYSVLINAYEHQQDWKSAFAYQRLYNAKKQEQQRAVNQTESLRSKAKFDRKRIETAYQQERLLQNQRYQTLAKQAEIDRLSSTYRNNELFRMAQTNDLKHQLETQQLRTVATQKQARQQATIKQLKIDQLRLGLSAQKRLRNQLFIGMAIISLLGLLLLYYSLRLRRTNVALRNKNREIEMALLKGQTIERKRVAVELHDRVSSLLGATKMTFQTIDAAILSPRNKELYESSLDLLDDAATQVRQLSHNLIPDQLFQQDLLVSLKGLVKKLNLTGSTLFSLISEPTGKLPLTPEVKFTLYVICLELCTNILRHAQAQHVHIRLIRHGNDLALQVSDDGIGIHHWTEAGMGLHNIRERAETIGARFRLESGEENGTKASILLPFIAW